MRTRADSCRVLRYCAASCHTLPHYAGLCGLLLHAAAFCGLPCPPLLPCALLPGRCWARSCWRAACCIAPCGRWTCRLSAVSALCLGLCAGVARLVLRGAAAVCWPCWRWRPCSGSPGLLFAGAQRIGESRGGCRGFFFGVVESWGIVARIAIHAPCSVAGFAEVRRIVANWRICFASVRAFCGGPGGAACGNMGNPACCGWFALVCRGWHASGLCIGVPGAVLGVRREGEQR